MVMTEIYEQMLRHKLTPNQTYFLHCIKHKTVPSNFINIPLEIQRLEQGGWVDNNEITPKTIAYLEGLENYFKKAKKKSSTDILGDNYIENLQGYLESFPNIKLPSGKPARVNVKSLENVFRWFFTEYDYTWETVFSATKLYLDEYEAQNWKYMRTSQYFIRKQNTDKTYESDLANYCDIILNGLDDNKPHFTDKVV